MANNVDIAVLKKADAAMRRKYQQCKAQRELLDLFLNMNDTSQIKGYSPRDVITACQYFSSTAETRGETARFSSTFIRGVMNVPRIRSRRLF